jgi:hypothetical protein
MLELSGMAIVRKTGHRPMQAPGHGYIAPTTITTNYSVDNSPAVWFPFTFPSQDIGEDGSMDGSGGAWECVREIMG